MVRGQTESNQNILTCKIRRMCETRLMNGASNMYGTRWKGREPIVTSKKLPFMTFRSSYSLAVLYSSNPGSYPCLLMTTYAPPTYVVVVTTFRHRLPTLDDDDDPLQQGYPSPFKADKKETGRWPNSSRFSARIIDNSAQSQTKYQFTFRILWYEFIKIKQKNRKQQVYIASSFKGIASLIHSDVIPGNLNAKQALSLEIDCRELQAGGSKDADSVLQTVVKRIATYLCEKQYWRFRVRFRDERSWVQLRLQ